MADDHVRARLRHRLRVVDGKDIRRRQHVLGASKGDHFDLERVGHAGLFEIGAHDPVDQSDGRKVLHARKAETLEVVEKRIEEAKRIGAVDAGEHRRLLDHRQHFMRHVAHDLVGVAIGEHAGEGAAPRHAVATGIVDDDEVDAARLLAFGGKARSRAAADDWPARLLHRLELAKNSLALESRHQALLSRRGPTDRKAAVVAAMKASSLMFALTRSMRRCAVWRTVCSSASNRAASASGS